MIDELRRPRPWMAGVAMIAGAATALACGDSSDEPAPKAAATQATSAAAPATTAAPAPAASDQPAESPSESGKDVPADVKAWSEAGTVRLAAVWIGTPGKLVVAPEGNVTKSDPKSWDHWYPKGTKVTVQAKDTRTARFAEWAGACSGKSHLCKVEMTGYLRVIGGFRLDADGAKGLPKDDPALKPGTGS
jgi:hypothetical protein